MVARLVLFLRRFRIIKLVISLFTRTQPSAEAKATKGNKTLRVIAAVISFGASYYLINEIWEPALEDWGWIALSFVVGSIIGRIIGRILRPMPILEWFFILAWPVIWLALYYLADDQKLVMELYELGVIYYICTTGTFITPFTYGLIMTMGTRKKKSLKTSSNKKRNDQPGSFERFVPIGDENIKFSIGYKDISLSKAQQIVDKVKKNNQFSEPQEFEQALLEAGDGEIISVNPIAAAKKETLKEEAAEATAA